MMISLLFSMVAMILVSSGVDGCVPTTGGNSDKPCCYFPFTYRGKVYNTCISLNNGGKGWCATTDDYFTDGKWRNCLAIKGCKFEGKTYKTGDKFTSSKKCASCTCTGGNNVNCVPLCALSAVKCTKYQTLEYVTKATGVAGCSCKHPTCVAKGDYADLGCYVDKGSRAISGAMTNYPANVAIKKCYERAVQEGNGYFSVQYNTQCFTSPQAGATYNKYGAGGGCANGRGGTWRNNVYQVTSGERNYANLGCYVDKGARAISGPMTNYPANVAIKMCYERAAAVGNAYFAVQYNTQCFTSPGAGHTYNQYGAAGGCFGNGRGGTWRNNVYRITSANFAYTNLGCYVDKGSRAISGALVNYPAYSAIANCYARAAAVGNRYFSVQYNTQCFTSPDAGATYAKYGKGNGCNANGRGGTWRQNVYKINSANFAYANLGCYVDRGSRAISGALINYPADSAIASCYARAIAAGNKYFAVQYNTQCFTSRDAGATYAKYGKGNGCNANGRGGTWRQNVYKISA